GGRRVPGAGARRVLILDPVPIGRMHHELAFLDDLAVPGKDDQVVGSEGVVVGLVAARAAETGRGADLFGDDVPQGCQGETQGVAAGRDLVDEQDALAGGLDGRGREEYRLLADALAFLVPADLHA